MAANLSADTAVSTSSDEYLEYQPPASSRLVGGTLDVNLVADGYGVDSSNNVNAVAVAALYEPALLASPGNLFFQCVAWLAFCPGTSGVDYSGTIALPADRGGNLYLQAEDFWFEVQRHPPTTLSDPQFSGGYVEGSWVITGERRLFNRVKGSFRNPEPKRDAAE